MKDMQLNQVNLNQLYSSLNFQHSTRQCQFLVSSLSFSSPPQFHTLFTRSMPFLVRSRASTGVPQSPTTLSVGFLSETSISTSAWILCSTLNSPWNAAGRGASSGEQRGIWEQIKNMNSNIPVGGICMRPGLQGSREITGRGREVMGLENFFMLTYCRAWIMHAT